MSTDQRLLRAVLESLSRAERYWLPAMDLVQPHPETPNPRVVSSLFRLPHREIVVEYNPVTWSAPPTEAPLRRRIALAVDMSHPDVEAEWEPLIDELRRARNLGRTDGRGALVIPITEVAEPGQEDCPRWLPNWCGSFIPYERVSPFGRTARRGEPILFPLGNRGYQRRQELEAIPGRLQVHMNRDVAQETSVVVDTALLAACINVSTRPVRPQNGSRSPGSVTMLYQAFTCREVLSRDDVQLGQSEDVRCGRLGLLDDPDRSLYWSNS